MQWIRTHSLAVSRRNTSAFRYTQTASHFVQEWSTPKDQVYNKVRYTLSARHLGISNALTITIVSEIATRPAVTRFTREMSKFRWVNHVAFRHVPCLSEQRSVLSALLHCTFSHPVDRRQIVVITKKKKKETTQPGTLSVTKHLRLLCSGGKWHTWRHSPQIGNMSWKEETRIADSVNQTRGGKVTHLTSPSSNRQYELKWRNTESR